MFPDRVHRLIVDGVVDAENYKKALWSDNLIDTEADWNGFFYHCARAGYPACALANENSSSTPQEISDKVANITQHLYHNPLPVLGPHPEVITWSDVHNLIFAAVYSPIQSFPFAADVLAALERGEGRAFSELLRGYHEFSCPAPAGSGFSIIPLRNQSGAAMSYDATMAIACSDGDIQSNTNRTAYREHVKELMRISPTIGSLWANARLQCVHYSIRPYHRFVGPWVGNTSHPLLMIGNTADPVTPLKFAKKMVKGFEGAVALTQDSSGHCSISAYSDCTVGYIRQYFQTGELPPPDTVCKADEIPFGPGPKDTETLSVEQVDVRRRYRMLGDAVLSSNGLAGRFAEAWRE